MNPSWRLIMLQLELFPEPREVKIERRLDLLDGKCDSLRKGQHARISKLQAKVDFLERELELLKAHLCKGLLC